MALPLNNLSQIHHIAAALTACGNSQAEIAAALGFNYSYYSAMSQSPIFVAEVERIRQILHARLIDNAVEKLQSTALDSVETIVDIRDNRLLSPTVRLRAASDLLDRVASTSKVTKHQQAPPEPLSLSDSQVEYLMNALNDDPLARQAFSEASQRSLLDVIDINAEPAASDSEVN